MWQHYVSYSRGREWHLAGFKCRNFARPARELNRSPQSLQKNRHHNHIQVETGFHSRHNQKPPLIAYTRKLEHFRHIILKPEKILGSSLEYWTHKSTNKGTVWSFLEIAGGRFASQSMSYLTKVHIGWWPTKAAIPCRVKTAALFATSSDMVRGWHVQPILSWLMLWSQATLWWMLLVGMVQIRCGSAELWGPLAECLLLTSRQGWL